MNTTTKTIVGVDTAKDVFQLHWVDAETGEVCNRSLKRAKFLEHFVNRSPCIIGMEACGGSHHWARQLTGWRLSSQAFAQWQSRLKNSSRFSRCTACASNW